MGNRAKPELDKACAEEDSARLVELAEFEPGSKAALHASGNCKPCRFVQAGRDTICRSGEDCRFCHFPHAQRPSKLKRARCKKRADAIDDNKGASDQRGDTLDRLATQGEYMKMVVAGKQRRQERESQKASKKA